MKLTTKIVQESNLEIILEAMNKIKTRLESCSKMEIVF